MAEIGRPIKEVEIEEPSLVPEHDPAPEPRREKQQPIPEEQPTPEKV